MERAEDGIERKVGRGVGARLRRAVRFLREVADETGRVRAELMRRYPNDWGAH